MVPVSLIYFKVPESAPIESSCAAACDQTATMARASPAEKRQRHMTRLRDTRLKHYFRLDRDDDFLALPFCHHRGCKRIADYVGGGPTHVEELIDANDH